MQLFIYESSKGLVRSIEGTPWPGKDSEGNTCYENTHFKTEREAWDSMLKDVDAGVKLSGRDVELALSRLRGCEEIAGRCCVEYVKVHDNYRKWVQESNPADQRAGLPGSDESSCSTAEISNSTNKDES